MNLGAPPQLPWTAAKRPNAPDRQLQGERPVGGRGTYIYIYIYIYIDGIMDFISQKVAAYGQAVLVFKDRIKRVALII